MDDEEYNEYLKFAKDIANNSGRVSHKKGGNEYEKY